MKKILNLIILSSILISTALQASSPVVSANGFVCGKEGETVTCKGPLPNLKDTLTATGHDIVYVTVNTVQSGVLARYTYFSDTGCLVGYTFNAAGKPVQAVASHRSGDKQTFEFGDGKYEKVLQYCTNAVKKDEAAAQASKTEETDQKIKQ